MLGDDEVVSSKHLLWVTTSSCSVNLRDRVLVRGSVHSMINTKSGLHTAGTFMRYLSSLLV
jgi:hypothetical protein